MMEVNEAAIVITENVDTNARIIFGASSDDTATKKGEIKITVVATGFDFDMAAPIDQQQRARKKIRLDSEEVLPSKEDAKKVLTEDSFVSSSKKIDEDKGEKDPMSFGDELTRPKKQDVAETTDTSSEDSEEDDLEIPAFIRKKLGK